MGEVQNANVVFILDATTRKMSHLKVFTDIDEAMAYFGHLHDNVVRHPQIVKASYATPVTPEAKLAAAMEVIEAAERWDNAHIQEEAEELTVFLGRLRDFKR